MILAAALRQGDGYSHDDANHQQYRPQVDNRQHKALEEHHKPAPAIGKGIHNSLPKGGAGGGQGGNLA